MQEDLGRSRCHPVALFQQQSAPAWMVSATDIQRAIQTLSCASGRVPTDSEIAQLLRIDLADYRLALRHLERGESSCVRTDEVAEAEAKPQVSSDILRAGPLFAPALASTDGNRGCLYEGTCSSCSSGEWIISAPEIEAAIRRLSAKCGRPPTDREVAEDLHIDLKFYWETLSHLKDLEMGMLYAAHDPGSDDEWLAYGTNSVEGDLLFRCLRSEMHALFRSAIRNLPTLERLVITLTYSEDIYDKSISVILQLPETSVWRIRKSAFLRLRASIPNPELQIRPRVQRLLTRTAESDTSEGTHAQAALDHDTNHADVTVHGQQDGMFPSGHPWESLGDNASWNRHFSSWYRLDEEQKLTQIKRLEHYRLDLES
jgi:DNA-directed RNA polymerase specialized sigma subunit